MAWPDGVEPRAVLLVRASHLGDVVHALPVFHALRARCPSARIGWVVQPEFAGLLRGLPGLDALIPFERARGARAWPPLLRALRAFRADVCVDAQGNLKSAAITRLSRARLRVGLARADWREPLGHRVLHASAPPCDGPHALDRMIGLARWIARDSALAPRRDPALAPAELAAGRAQLEALLPGSVAARPIVLHLSDARDVRGWPTAHWIELARELARAGRPTLVISGPAEAALGAELARAVPAGPHIAHLVGQRGLRELAALLAAAAARGARLVACDSGPLHLACSVDLPTLALAGPQDPRRTGPYPPHAHRALTSPDELACRPCLARRCAHPRGPVCLSELSPALVAAACARD
ncbi:MAG: lipopolysaccharide heptosyltransferase family protein [Planctomycetota bacterium]|nr:MAG: lipopolysaccharide heptosyltransferase family protein [Planctomycetota bacterium]